MCILTLFLVLYTYAIIKYLNFEKLPNTLSGFEQSLDEMLSDYCEDYEYYKNTEDLYKKIKSILV